MARPPWPEPAALRGYTQTQDALADRVARWVCARRICAISGENCRFSRPVELMQFLLS